MSLSGYGGRLDRKRSNRWRMAMFRLLAYAAVVGAIAYWAYSMGGERLANRNRALEQQMVVLKEENDRLQVETDAAVSARASAVDRASRLQRQYEREVPQGEVREIMDAVVRRLAEGVEPDRVAFVVEAMRKEVWCGPDVTSRRFIVQTPLSEGGNGSVTFANRAITVTGTGEASVDPDGNQVGWFDNTKAVAISFSKSGGETSGVEGMLPLQHAVVLKDKVHRFTVDVGDTRGFVTVSERLCDYP